MMAPCGLAAFAEKEKNASRRTSIALTTINGHYFME